MDDLPEILFALVRQTCQSMPYAVSERGQYGLILYSPRLEGEVAILEWIPEQLTLDIQAHVLWLQGAATDEFLRALMKVNAHLETGCLALREEQGRLMFRYAARAVQTEEFATFARNALLYAVSLAHQLKPLFQRALEGASAEEVLIATMAVV